MDIDLSVWEHRLAQVPEEMGATLRRAALSPNIKERRDYSCALCDERGRLLAQAAHIPVHLGSTEMAVKAVIRALCLGPDDVAVVNDPFAGGTHLPDLTLVMPVHAPGHGLIGHLAVRAHHADVGGAAPGSMGVPPTSPDVPSFAAPPPAVGPRYLAAGAPPHSQMAMTIDDEGVRLAPTLLTAEVEEAFIRRCRNGRERRGDLLAQRAALTAGARRLLALCERHGAAEVLRKGAALIRYADRLTSAALAAIPDGVYAFADSLDDDGAGRSDIAIRLTLEKSGARLRLDFSDSDDEVEGPLNAVLPVTLSAVMYALRLLLPEGAPTNAGCMERVEVIARPGSIVHASPPRAVSSGNTETAQRIVDVVLGALAQALPGRVPAASCGSMNNLLIGDSEIVYYETIAGGAGASAAGDGQRAIHTHMTNTLNTPVEALEHALPLRVRRYEVRRGSGGEGVHRGGDGVVREIELLRDATVTLVGERRRRPPYGQGGGGPGACGIDTLQRGGRTVHLPGKVCFQGRAGDVITVATPGGGGSGDATRTEFFADLLSGT